MFVVLVTAVSSMPLGVVQFMMLYHPVHDFLKIHTEVSVLMFLMIFGLLAWSGDRHPTPEGRALVRTADGHPKARKWFDWIDEVWIALVMWYTYYIVLVNWGTPRPEDIRVTGVHEQTGPCNETLTINGVTGPVDRRKYLCVTDYDEDIFDWHCLPGGKPPGDYLHWYTMCGTPYPNYAEYRLIVTGFSLLGLYVFYQVLSRSGRPEPIHPSIQGVSSRKKTK